MILNQQYFISSIAEQAKESTRLGLQETDFDNVVAGQRPFVQKAFNRMSFGRLQQSVLDEHNNPILFRSGIRHPQPRKFNVEGLKGQVELEQAGQFALGIDEAGVDIYVVDFSDGSGISSATMIGNVVSQRRNGEHYNNVAPGLEYDLSSNVARLALATYHVQATTDEHHD